MCRSVPQMLAASMRTRTSSAPGCRNGDLVQDEPLLGTPLANGTHRLHGETILPRRTRRAARDRVLGVSQQSIGSPPGSRRGCGSGRVDPTLPSSALSAAAIRRTRAGVSAKTTTVERPVSSSSLVPSSKRSAGTPRTLVRSREPDRPSASSYRPRFRRHAGQTWISAGGAHPASSRARAVPVDEGDELGGVLLDGVPRRAGGRRRARRR